MRKIMILGAGMLQLPAIHKAIEMNLEVVAVDMDPGAIGFQVPGVIREVISTIDSNRVLDAARRHRIDGIMTLASDMPMRTVAKVAEELKLVAISKKSAIKATNKAEMRKALKKNNVPIPHFYVASTYNDFLNAVTSITNLGMKCIIKPIDNSGSRGIQLIEDLSETALKEAFSYSKSYSRSGEIMVEEFMEGQEVSVETVSISGECKVIQITDKITTGAPHFVELGHSQPSQLSPLEQEKIMEVAVAANKAIGINSGPSHTEIKLTEAGPKVVEIGARLGGDNITTKLVPLSTGIDLVEICIRIAIGEEPEIPKSFQRGAAIRYFRQQNGVLQDIKGLEFAKELEGIEQISLMYKNGEKITEIINSTSRLGFVIASGKDASEAISICEGALSIIELEIV
ncbi:ATP-grasp domain-containing protein [Streptococcus suis]|uniref:ATP-grasp domain-containing protein n=1 Tax=Streptococcus suis TaxID=1307 RepID=UPI003797AB33